MNPTVTPTGQTQALVAIDVVAFVLPPDSPLSVVAPPRLFEPHLGEQALPGVLLGHERTNEAAARALRSKAGIEASLEYVDAGVFDNSDRDPRGPTLSIVKATAVAAETVGVVEAQARLIPVTAFAAGERVLPFDHDAIVAQVSRQLFEAWWTSGAVLARALLGEEFTVRQLCTVLEGLALAGGVSATVDAGNVTRALTTAGWATKTSKLAAPPTVSGGRRPNLWVWA